MKIVDPQKVFGASVKVSRKLLGISQETLAERAELHRTYISDVERGAGNPSLKTIFLLDLSLPKLSGLEVLRSIKADPLTCKMPVVVLTGSSDNADIAECRRLGAITFITKPLNWKGFGAAMKKINLNWVLLKPPGARLVATPI